MEERRFHHTGETGPNLGVLWPDGAIVCLLAIGGVYSGCAAVLALAVYTALILARDSVCVLVRRHGNRQHSRRYEFGTGKLEQAANLALATVKFALGLWLAYLVLGDGRVLRSIPTQGELGLLALLGALYVMRCASIAWIGRSAAGMGLRPIGSSATTRLAVAVSFQVAITIAAIVHDRAIAGFVLSMGTLLLAFALFMSGLRQARNSVLDLVDHPPDPATDTAIRAVLANLQCEEEIRIVDLRARRAGNDLFVELTVAEEPQVHFDEVRRRIAGLRDRVRAALPDSDIVIRLSSAPFVSADGQL